MDSVRSALVSQRLQIRLEMGQLCPLFLPKKSHIGSQNQYWEFSESPNFYIFYVNVSREMIIIINKVFGLPFFLLVMLQHLQIIVSIFLIKQVYIPSKATPFKRMAKSLANLKEGRGLNI